MATEDEGRIRYEILDPERDVAGALLINRGLLALPEPASGDLFFDIEGARYYSEDGNEFGLQYLFGVVEDDCRATLALRDWLEQRRANLAGRLGEELPRPAAVEEPESTEDPEVTRIRSALLAGLPTDVPERTGEQNAKALLADLLDWHRREAKPAWWRYFQVRTMSAPELVDEPDALGGLTGGDVVDQVKRSVVRRFAFPPQEYKFKRGDTAVDPASGKGYSVWAVDDEHGTIDLKAAQAYAGPWPAALVEDSPVNTTVLAERLRDLGDRVLREGVAGQDAGTALLLRLRPDAGGGPAGPLRGDGESVTDAAVRLVLALRGSYLPIQGPPGTGKTFTAAGQILELIKAGRAAGITGPSHAVIHNLLGKVIARAGELGVVRPRIGQRPGQDTSYLHPGAAGLEHGALETGLRDGDLDIGAGTAWLWAREQFQGTIDTLFVDEAGQMSLASILAVAGAARNLVLIGDPQQLAQPSQAAHPPGAGVSALEHILGDHRDRAAGRGPAPGSDLADAPAAVPVHVGDVLRREADLRPGAGTAGDSR